MYNLIEKRKRFLSEPIEKIKIDFKKELKPFFESYMGFPVTKQILWSMQNAIDIFLERHRLNIKVDVIEENGRVVCLGVNIIDELVWEAIQY